MNTNRTSTIVFITGAFVSHHCWDPWREYFESKGYRTLAPSWPYKDAPPEVLRGRHPDAEVASIRLAGLTAYYADIVRALPEKPILVGHSMGGLITQLLLQRDLGAMGIAIHSVAPLGVVTFKLSFLKAAWGPLSLFSSLSETFLMSYRQWQFAFTNGMDCDKQKEAYYQLLIPESKRIVRDGLSKAARVDFSRKHAPLLFVAGSTDHFIPASLNYSNFKKYRDGGSVREYKVFEGRNHFVLGQDTWREDAGFIQGWIEQYNK